MIFRVYDRRLILNILIAAFYAQIALGQPAQREDDGDLQAVIVLMRHGVRAPIENETRSNIYNAQAWPTWPTEPGVLTPHGSDALRRLAEFYRERYSTLLQDDTCDHPMFYVEANTTQRTIASARAVLAGLSPKCKVEVHSTVSSFNPLFSLSMSNDVDQQRIKDATSGRMARTNQDGSSTPLPVNWKRCTPYLWIAKIPAAIAPFRTFVVYKCRTA